MEFGRMKVQAQFLLYLFRPILYLLFIDAVWRASAASWDEYLTCVPGNLEGWKHSIIYNNYPSVGALKGRQLCSCKSIPTRLLLISRCQGTMRPFQALILLSAALTQARRPNIIFILTDDQDVFLGGTTPLTATKRLLTTSFTNAFAVTPVCCPSRSSILTGLYLHSHGTVNNSLSGGCSSPTWQHHHEGRTFATLLHDAGYRTFYAGKYLNKYGSKGAGGVRHVPKGWDWWIGLVGNSVYYNYTLSVNGSGVERGDRERDYLTDVLRDYSLEFLKDRQSRERPFLMMIAPPAPHEPFTPAERHRGRFAGMKAPRTPNFNVAVNTSKHWLLRLPPQVLPPETIDKVDEIFRNRWETLLAVDDLVQSLVNRLRELQLFDDTYIMLSSDHGFHLGQFALPWDKRQPYETDIRIPLLLRGPQIPTTVSRTPVLTIDFAATILDMAEMKTTFGDGQSFLREVNALRSVVTPRSFVVEYRGEGEGGGNECWEDPDVKLCQPEASCKCFDARNNTFRCVRRVSETEDDIRCRFWDGEAFEEYYDLRRDPFQMQNLAFG